MFEGFEAAEREKNRQKEQAVQIRERARLFYFFVGDGDKEALYEIVAPDGQLPEVGSYVTIRDGKELVTYRVSTIQYSTMERPNGMLVLNEPRVGGTEYQRQPAPAEVQEAEE